MRGLLFGLQIPDAAAHVEVRPYNVGRGRQRALYRGPLDEGGRVVHEDDLCDLVATDARYWEYLQSVEDSDAAQSGRLCCKVSVQFLDQNLAPLVVGDKGETWAHSAETYEFVRRNAGKSGKGRKRKKADAARAVGDAVASLAPALERIVATAVRESTAQVTAALALAKQHADKLEKQLDREAERVDSAIEEMADRSKGAAQAPASSGGGLRTLFDLVGVAKDVKSFLN